MRNSADTSSLRGRVASRLLLISLAWAVLVAAPADAAPARPPNIVVILADDLGYGDLGCYGSPTINTPQLDAMAREGLRFTDFYVPAAVCSPSRAGLLTGRYPVRSGMFGVRNVLYPDSPGGLPRDEITIATALGQAGYATGHIGKWHLGIHSGSTPRDHGFAYAFGVPYSNDMDPRPGLPKGMGKPARPPADGWRFPLLRNGEVIERPVDQTTLTRRYTQEAVAFIRRHQRSPFFLYVAHTFPHTPLFASPPFKGRSRRGIYGDTVEELDWSVGEVLAALRAAGVADNTLVVFTSDNGPWLTHGLQGGSAGPLRDGKGSTWEGGMRVPAIAWWPGRIQPGTTGTPVNAMDLFPTSLALAGVKPPGDRAIDGRDLAPVLFHRQPLPERPFFYYRKDQLAACRLGAYKLHLFTQAGYGQPEPDIPDSPLLFNLEYDPGERFDVAAEHPEVVAKIRALMEEHGRSFTPGPPQF
jgi:arylsulfatase A